MQHPIDVRGDTSQLFELINPIRRQSTTSGIKPERIDRGKSMPLGRFDNDAASCRGKRTRRDNQPAARLAGEGGRVCSMSEALRTPAGTTCRPKVCAKPSTTRRKATFAAISGT